MKNLKVFLLGKKKKKKSICFQENVWTLAISDQLSFDALSFR